MQSTPLWPSFPGPHRPGLVASVRVLFMGQTEQNCVLMLNWIVWNRTVFKLKLCTYVKIIMSWHLTVCKQKTVLMLNWIVWNRTIYMYKKGLGIK